MRNDGAGNGGSAIVALPAEIDLTNTRQAYDPLYAALVSGAPVVVADFTATVFCDAAGVHSLLMLRDLAAALGIGFRLVIPPGGLLRRVLELLAVDHLLSVYPNAEEAARLLVPLAQDPLSSYFPLPSCARSRGRGEEKARGARSRRCSRV